MRRPRKKRFKLWPGRNGGQSLVLFAIVLPVLIVFVAFVVDGAHAFVAKNRVFPQT